MGAVRRIRRTQLQWLLAVVSLPIFLQLIGPDRVAAQGMASGPPPPPSAKSIECKGRQIPQFEDITQKTGIHFTHSSAPEARYIVESMGGGVLLLDYDRDGWEDIYFTNAPTVEMAARGALSQQSRRNLYRCD